MIEDVAIVVLEKRLTERFGRDFLNHELAWLVGNAAKEYIGFGVSDILGPRDIFNAWK